MIGLILAVGLLLPHAAQAQVSPSEKAARIEALASGWQGVRAEASRMENEFRANVRRADPDQADKVFKNLDNEWAYREKLVRHLQDWRISLGARYRSQAVAGIITASEAHRRIAYIDRMFQLRMLQIYGNMTPLALTEEPNGSRWIGPSWRVVVKLDEVHQAYGALLAQSGFLADDVVDDPAP